jgi:hypothetical protein
MYKSGWIQYDVSMEKKQIKLLEAFASLPDPRVERAKRHSADDILFIAITTLLTGGRSFYDMEECGHGWEPWFREILTLENGIPSHDTFTVFFKCLTLPVLKDALDAGRNSYVSNRTMET